MSGGRHALICDFGGVIARVASEPVAAPRTLNAAERLLATLELDEDMLAYVEAVADRGWRTALLTNNSHRCGPEWRARFPAIKKLFDVIIDASVAGVRKPDRAAYELTLAALGADPCDCVFVDDVEQNCAAAAALGMHVVWFRTCTQAIDELEAACAATSGGRLRGQYSTVMSA